MRLREFLRVTGIGLLVAAAASVLAVLVVRDQISRHRRDLFSSRPLRRLAALGYLAGSPPSVDSIRLLRDYTAWEPQPLIRRQAEQVIHKMERNLRTRSPHPGEAAG